VVDHAVVQLLGRAPAVELHAAASAEDEQALSEGEDETEGAVESEAAVLVFALAPAAHQVVCRQFANDE